MDNQWIINVAMLIQMLSMLKPPLKLKEHGQVWLRLGGLAGSPIQAGTPAPSQAHSRFARVSPTPAQWHWPALVQISAKLLLFVLFYDDPTKSQFIIEALSGISNDVDFLELKSSSFHGLSSLWISEEEILALAAPF
ncbi:hypothetical protein IEQ34_019169 [Dendrobium chrysotoxum]|uniref:Uncharacterized protein n=1 Tax=Dendrobium chrysotoxum TaxID=161865 RepID=A0AAV7G704_DENCH|nr:hypothetical protein IEQ34_019169 [Dendrobium chrysotoxum]